jgi:peptide-methionine (S)-S-oxide reductase
MSFLSRLFSNMTSHGIAPTPAAPAGSEIAYLAAGCFWGVEHVYRAHFPALKSVSVGYIGGAASNPSYRAVCTGSTGHAEAIRVVFDPAEVEYRNLVEFFYRMHDPTTLNSQGPDRGSQYRSAIFTTTPTQSLIAKDVTERAQKDWWRNKIVTTIEEADKWWNAEEYHQEYLDKNSGGYECPSHYIRKFEALSRPEPELKAESVETKSEL